MFEKLSIISSAISEVVRFPVRSQIILGGEPCSMDKSKKSASKVTTVKPFSLAYCHISTSLRLCNPTERTCRQSEKLSGKERKIRNEIFWSNSNLISDVLQITFSFGSESKAGKNIPTGQFRKIGKNLIVSHVCRQPAQHIVNGDAGISYTGLPKTLFGINADNIVKNSHNNYLKNYRHKGTFFFN